MKKTKTKKMRPWIEHCNKQRKMFIGKLFLSRKFYIKSAVNMHENCWKTPKKNKHKSNALIHLHTLTVYMECELNYFVCSFNPD